MATPASSKSRRRDTDAESGAKDTSVDDQDKADLERSMQNLHENMDAVDEEEVEPGTHPFDEESVEKDKQRGLENISHLQDIITKQAYVYGAVMAKVNEGGAEVTKAKKEAARAESPDNRYNSSLYPPAESDTYRVQNACLMADQLAKRQLRKDCHQRRMLEIAAEEKAVKDALRDRHHSSDQRATKRQQERVDRQMELTLVAQQRRNEQQKMLKEHQRDQDHQFEVLQMKHHPQKSNSHGASVAAPTDTKTPQKPDGEPAKMSRSLSEPIYRDMCQSHKKYASTLESWQTFEADNERRTEAYWRKMGVPPKRTAAKPETTGRISMFRNAAKTITAVRKFVRHTQGSQIMLEPGSANEELEPVDTVAYSGRSLEMKSISNLSAASPREDMKMLYDARREQAKAYHDDLEMQRTLKAMDDKRFLEQKRALGQAAQNAKASRAGEANKAWEKRNEESDLRRKLLGVKNDGQFVAKMDAAQIRSNEIEARANEERRRLAARNTDTQVTTKNRANQGVDDRVANYDSRRADKDERGAELLEVRMKGAEHRANANELGEQIELRLKAKKQLEREFRRNTQDEIDHKATRQQEALKRVGKLPQSHQNRDQAKAMERHRLMRTDKGRDDPSTLAPPPELALPPELDVPRLLSPKSAGTPKSPASPSFFGGQESGDRLDALEKSVDLRKSMSSNIGRAQSSMSLGPSGGKCCCSGRSGLLSPMKELVFCDPSEGCVDCRFHQLQNYSDHGHHLGQGSVDQLDVLAQSMDTMVRRSVGNVRKPTQTPSSMLSASAGVGSSEANLGASGGGSSRGAASNDGSDSESEGEALFLDDLRVQSSKWLQQMRTERA